VAVTGGFCPLPLRLGGDALTGMTAEQHARACADMVAVKRTARFCVFNWAVSGGVVTVTGYRGMNGVGAAHAPTVLSHAANVVTIRWATMRFSDSYQVAAPFLPRHAVVQLTRATYGRATYVLLTDGIEIRAFDAAGGAIADPFTGSCEIW
jgi:hypothetical protein